MYAVCQTSRCQQTYLISELGTKKEDFKNISCDKCGGVVVDKNGRGNISQHAAVRPVVNFEELEEQKKKALKEKREQIKQLQNDILRIEESDCY